MQALRKTALVIAAAMLPIFLFSFGLTFSLIQIFGTSDHVKSALRESGVYSTLLGDALADTETKEGDQGIPVDRPEVQQIIQQSAPPDFLQTQTERFLDSFYVWMSGETKQLEVEINLTEAKAKLTDGLTHYAVDRMKTLPVCTSPVPSNSFDPLYATCLPPGLDQGAAVEKVRQEIAEGEFLKDPVLTEENISSNEGKSLQEQLQAVPGIYRLIKINLWVSGGLLVLLTAAIIILSQPWRIGMKRAGIIFLSVGTVTAILAWTAGFLSQKLVDSLAKSDQGDMQVSLAKILNILTNNLRSWWLTYGLIILALGVAAIVAQKFIKPKNEVAPTPEKEIQKDEPKTPPAKKT